MKDSCTENISIDNPHNPATGIERPRSVSCRVRLALLLMVTVVAALGVHFSFHIYRYRQHSRVFNRMQAAIASLSFHSPEDLTANQWAGCIAWTWNLNANSAAIPPFMPTTDLRRILEELETRIDDGPNLATIEWIWSEYNRSSRVDYQRFKPTLAKNWAVIEKHEKTLKNGEDPLLEWQTRYQKMRP